jgi:hypothetical protein
MGILMENFEGGMSNILKPPNHLPKEKKNS